MKEREELNEIPKEISVLFSLSPAFEAAYHLALKAHEGQKRKTGQPYITHVNRVILATADHPRKYNFGISKNEHELLWIVAALHDAYEDNPKFCTLELIFDTLKPFFKGLEIPTKLTKAIEIISKKTRGSYEYADYVNAVSGNALARIVKIFDVQDNMADLEHGSLRDKYSLTLDVLFGIYHITYSPFKS